MPLIHIPKDARVGKEPCGECHLHEGETCDICGAKRITVAGGAKRITVAGGAKRITVAGGAKRITVAGDDIFIHVTPRCEHDFAGWREFDDGRGGEQVCTKCGVGAMTASLRDGL